MRELPDHWISLQEVIKQHSPVAKAFWGLARKEGLPCGDCWLSLSVTDQNFQLCYSSASHILLPRRHMEAQRPKARARRPTSSASASLPVGRLPSPLLPQLSRVKTALLRPYLESLSGSKLRFKVRFQSFGICSKTLAQRSSPINVYRRMGKWTSLETKEPLKWAISGL